MVVQGILGCASRWARIAPTYSAADLGAVALTAGVLALWVEATQGTFNPRVFLAGLVTLLAFYLVGSLFAAWKRLALGVAFDLPLRLLVGYIVVNTTMFALAWISPFGIVANFALLAGLVAVLFVAARPRLERTDAGPENLPLLSKLDSSVGLLALGVSLAAATLWCQDSLRAPSVQNHTIVFEPWIDSFYHAVHLRIFGVSHGASSIEDFRLAGVPARLYHYASYLSPALIGRLSGIASYTTFSTVLSPLAVLFTGLGAYALAGSLFGRWPGLMACAALLLLPDGAEQGMRNTIMSYRWLTQISPSASFGLALVAVAWIFVLRGCTQGNRLQVLAGWMLGALLVVYKAHFFVASALLLILIPPIFFRASLRPRVRMLWAGGALGLYLLAIVAVRNVPGLPLIRFDGSAIPTLLGFIARFTKLGALRGYLIDRLGVDSSLLSNLLVGTPFVLFAALGLFVPLLGVLAAGLHKRMPRLFWIFPLVILVNFLAMFLGLALDMRTSTPEELSHRPVMVVYFVVVTWIGGAVGLLLFESKRLGRWARPFIASLAIVLMAVPAYFGAGIHRMWLMPSISPPLRVPAGLVRAAEYVRAHSSAHEIVQDSQFDRFCVVAALSERRAFVARSMTIMEHNADRVQARVDAVEQIMSLRDARTLLATLRRYGIHWFLLNPGDQLAWPESIVNQPVFELDGYKLYRFSGTGT